MIKDSQVFIDLGWYTTPLSGELKRLENGKKTIPIFEKNWKQRALARQYKEPAELAGAMTGRESGIIAIDCDDTVTYNIFKALDPEYKFHFISRGKKINDVLQESATIIYKYTDELPDGFKISSSLMRLDFLSNNGMTYLPTAKNYTKEPFELCELKDPPKEVIAVLQQMYVAKTAPSQIVHMGPRSRFNLAPLLEQFVRSKGEVTRALFRTLTPKEFRTEPGYIEKGYLHPDEVRDGAGSTYLSQVSAILGADNSVDEELYTEAMVLINKQFSNPMDSVRLEDTILDRMVRGKAIGSDGEVIWSYDPDWAENSVSFQTKTNDIINIFYDYRRLLYYCIDSINEEVISFDTPHRLSQHISSVCIEQTSTKEVIALVPNILADTKPEMDFGFFTNSSGREGFNMFISTTPYKVFKNPEEYAPLYTVPTTTIKFFETLIPDDMMRAYFLGFIKRKLNTFDYSPVILYFLGVQGSGKDTAVKLLQRILGVQNFASPSAKEFLETHNGWLVDKFFAQLNEFGDQLTSARVKEEALGRLKSYTGAPSIQVRQMHTDGYQYEHKITFIMTSNRNPLMLDADDRRIALFHTPTALVNAPWVAGAGGISAVINQIEHETNDFCYWLATEIPSVSADEYNTPPASADKARLIAESMPPAKKLAYYLKLKNWVEIRKIFDLYAPAQTLAYVADSRILEEDLIETYENMHGGDMDKPAKIVRQAMAEHGFKQMRTMLQGRANVYYYVIPGLKELLDYPSAMEED